MMAFYQRVASEEAQRRAALSKKEAENFVERELKCPVCNFMIGVAYSDSKGHLRIKCQKCKTVSVLNFAYFCRRKYKRRYRSGGAHF